MQYAYYAAASVDSTAGAVSSAGVSTTGVSVTGVVVSSMVFFKLD
jgi:hypothetical protein